MLDTSSIVRHIFKFFIIIDFDRKMLALKMFGGTLKYYLHCKVFWRRVLLMSWMKTLILITLIIQTFSEDDLRSSKFMLSIWLSFTYLIRRNRLCSRFPWQKLASSIISSSVQSFCRLRVLKTMDVLPPVQIKFTIPRVSYVISFIWFLLFSKAFYFTFHCTVNYPLSSNAKYSWYLQWCCASNMQLQLVLHKLDNLLYCMVFMKEAHREIRSSKHVLGSSKQFFALRKMTI